MWYRCPGTTRITIVLYHIGNGVTFVVVHAKLRRRINDVSAGRTYTNARVSNSYGDKLSVFLFHHYPNITIAEVVVNYFEL